MGFIHNRKLYSDENKFKEIHDIKLKSVKELKFQVKKRVNKNKNKNL